MQHPQQSLQAGSLKFLSALPHQSPRCCHSLGNLAGDIAATNDNGEINLGVNEAEVASVKSAETILTPPARGTSSTKAFAYVMANQNDFES